MSTIDGTIRPMIHFCHVLGEIHGPEREFAPTKRESIMKKCLLSILVLAFLSSAAAAQAVIENPAKPSSENAGRLVTLKEEMRIEDTGEGFYFKNPYTIRVSPRGDIFIQDGQEQALHFDPQGRFVRNLYKKGQGPGELTVLLDIWASRDRLFLLGYPPKILIYDYDGNLIKELSLRNMWLCGSVCIGRHGRSSRSKSGPAGSLRRLRLQGYRPGDHRNRSGRRHDSKRSDHFPSADLFRLRKEARRV